MNIKSIKLRAKNEQVLNQLKNDTFFLLGVLTEAGSSASDFLTALKNEKDSKLSFDVVKNDIDGGYNVTITLISENSSESFIANSNNPSTNKIFQKPFSFKGRIRRTEYGISIIIFVVIVIVIDIIIALIKKPIPVFIIYIPMIWILLAQGAKRCHDRGNNGWFQFIPFYAFWMVFADSNKGINKYGLYPKGGGNSEQPAIDKKESINTSSFKMESESKIDFQQEARNSLHTSASQVISESASIKLILSEIKGVIGLKSITFLLDDQPLNSISLGGAGVFEVSPGQHTIQTIMKAGSIFTLFITLTRRSKVLTLNTSPNTQVTVMASYNRTWGNIELKPVANI